MIASGRCHSLFLTLKTMPGALTEHEHIGTCSEAKLGLLLSNITNILENFKISLLND